MGKKQFLSMWFSGPARNKSPRLWNSPGTPLPWLWLSSLAPRALGQELWQPGAGCWFVTQDVAEETEADDDHTKPNPLLPPLLWGPKIAAFDHCNANTPCCHLLLAEGNALYIKLPWINCCWASSQKAEAGSSQLTINTWTWLFFHLSSWQFQTNPLVN